MSSSVFDPREPESLTAENCSGSRQFKILNYSKSAESHIFILCGHEWTFRYYPNGKRYFLDDYLAFELNLKSDAKVRAKITLTMLSQTGGTPFVRDSESGDGTDVSFNVSGVTFNAHQCVLVARSPVFKAQLLGPMKDKMDKSIIEIKDMEPSIFKSMLYFIYSDSVAELEEIDGNEDSAIVLAQHFLVAADRYNLERLKELCEIVMYEFIDVDNVATALTLAEQHNCFELKAACIEFIKRPEVLAIVALTEGFEHRIKSSPQLLVELRSKNHGC
ncbi:BTB/POZ and MATH domain-containing protein 2 [Rhynchospora pubera]|uniref:BTB/POZ and MATH domain-containing protein 2 n=1 Tax=Rhynchospora pubera TaxID=906938 RepID=A0AAV8CDJ0_9POAL|nr:BTB/POZ and MATH domain-containing protein 2 [Rhynchospora pubera]